jgi:hypothetical protein
VKRIYRQLKHREPRLCDNFLVRRCTSFAVFAALLFVCASIFLSAQQVTSPAFEISSAKQSYYGGESFYLHVKVLDSGLAPNLRENCPLLQLRHRSPNGETRTDEIPPVAFAGCKWKRMGAAVGDWQNGFDLDAGARSRWEGFGEHEFQVSQFTGKTAEWIQQFAISNTLKVQVVDPTLVERQWVGRDKGVWVDVTLDRDTYHVGEEISLHIAIQNHDADVPIYSDDTVWDPPVVEIQVLDALGRPLPTETRFESSSVWTGHGRGPKAYEKSKIVTEELHLRGIGWLPKRPGDYFIVVTWAVSTGPEAVEGMSRSELYPLLKPYTTARANARLRIEP